MNNSQRILEIQEEIKKNHEEIKKVLNRKYNKFIIFTSFPIFYKKYMFDCFKYKHYKLTNEYWKLRIEEKDELINNIFIL